MDQPQIFSLSIFKLQIHQMLPWVLQDYPYTQSTQILSPRFPPDVASFLQTSCLTSLLCSKSSSGFSLETLLSSATGDSIINPFSEENSGSLLWICPFPWRHSDVYTQWPCLQCRSILSLFFLIPFINPPNECIVFTIDHFCFLLLPFNSVPQTSIVIEIEIELVLWFKILPPLSIHLLSDYSENLAQTGFFLHHSQSTPATPLLGELSTLPHTRIP